MLDTNVIPNGSYCYTIIKIEQYDGKMPIIKTKLCPYWNYDVPMDKYYCTYCEIEHPEYEQDWLILSDQCKICGINDDEY